MTTILCHLTHTVVIRQYFLSFLIYSFKGRAFGKKQKYFCMKMSLTFVFKKKENILLNFYLCVCVLLADSCESLFDNEHIYQSLDEAFQLHELQISVNKRFNYHRRSIHVMPRFNSAVANSLESASTSSSNSSSSNTLSQTSE